jgi:hypothetical protein
MEDSHNGKKDGGIQMTSQIQSAISSIPSEIGAKFFFLNL